MEARPLTTKGFYYSAQLLYLEEWGVRTDLYRKHVICKWKGVSFEMFCDGLLKG
jgi:hypothetical protein